MGKHFDKDFKEMVVNDYKSGNSGGRIIIVVTIIELMVVK